MLHTQRYADPLAKKEAELLQHINQKVSASFRQRYKKLIARRQAETLTPQELTALLKMTDEMEAHNVARLEALVQLAALRGISLDAVMQQLGIQAVSHG